jgi:hypothetical protein
MDIQTTPRSFPPLDDPSTGIRLLESEDRQGDDPTSCTLAVWTRSDAPDNNALSYNQGPSQDPEEIVFAEDVSLECDSPILVLLFAWYACSDAYHKFNTDVRQ